jgi:sigma-B regulation protein RsbU (phosphoserine phosphatase)
VEVIGDVNEILCRDTERSGAFVSLFYLVIDSVSRRLSWVRCGHDAAIVYDMDTHQFSELHGEGLVLGFDADWRFQENGMDINGRRLAIFLGSDGVWETENSEGECFGKERVRNILAENSHRSSAEIITAITEAVETFRDGLHQVDDVTLVVVKTDGGPLPQ